MAPHEVHRARRISCVGVGVDLPKREFESLSAGVQSALWRLGGVPLEHRTDNRSAVTRELAERRGGDFTKRYRELMDHYGLRASRNFPVTPTRTATSSRRTVG